MNIKLIAIDMDNTLLNSNLEISNMNKEAINKAIDKGIKVVLCTGRPTNGAIQATKDLGLYGTEAYLITYHGAVTTDLKTMERVTTHPISPEEVKSLFELSHKLGVSAYGINDEAMDTTHAEITDMAKYESKLMNLPIKQHTLDSLDTNKVYDKFMLINQPEKIDCAENNLPKELHNQFTIMRSDPRFLEFINISSDKGTAVDELAAKLSIPIKEVMGIGDGGNDFHLIETAGIGVAMANAIPELKEIADDITDSNDNDGVAKAIYKWVLS